VGGTGIDITEFINEILRSKDKGVSTMLVDRIGAIQAHENREYVQHNANVKDDTRKITLYSLMDHEEDRVHVAQSMENLTSEKSDVETFFISLQKNRYLAAVTYMKGIRWYNVVLVDVSQVIRFIDFLPIIGIIVLSLFSILVIIAVMLNNVVLKPLAMLTEASRRVSRGEYGIALPVTRKDEIGQLTASFNIMTAKILDSTRDLENRVHDRTVALSDANRQLKEAQKQVMDSILYARLIQSSMLPDTSLLDGYLKEYFILNLPRDILGGDFCYFRNAGENFLLAVIDCTGHGVPGALITMTVNAVLNHIVDRLGADDPARLLGELNFLMHHTLHSDASNLLIESGVDIGLCLCLPAEEKVIFAGAGLALYRFDGKEIAEIRGDRRAARP
jgi:phosphoserine phosphatase RsbU/P